jgi:PKD repeat protein
MKFVHAFALCLLAMLCAAPMASAYRLMPYSRPYAGPTVTYYNATKYTAQMRVIEFFINAHNVGVRIKSATSMKAAQIKITYAPASRRLHCGGGTAGFGGQGGLIIATNCKSAEAMAVMAHEFGHTLGLAHEDRHCDVMNAYFDIQANGSVRPRHCRSTINFFKTPYAADDIAGLRARFANHAPVAKLTIQNLGASAEQGEQIYTSDMSTDADSNIIWRSMDWGDGTPVATKDFLPGWSSSNWAGEHVYATPGAFTATLTVRDSYGKIGTMTATATVTAVPDVCPNIDDTQSYVPDGMVAVGGLCVPIPVDAGDISAGF